MNIDEEKLYRLTNYKGKETKETDHNTIIVELNDARQHQETDKKVRWNKNNKKKAGKYTKKIQNITKTLT